MITNPKPYIQKNIKNKVNNENSSLQIDIIIKRESITFVALTNLKELQNCQIRFY